MENKKKKKKKMEQTKAQLKASQKYKKTKKGKITKKRDEISKKGKARKKRYINSEKGWLKQKARCLKYAKIQKKKKFNERFKRQKEVTEILNKYFDEVSISEHTFYDLRDNITERRLRCDCFFKKKKILVEINGYQHYFPTRFGNISIKKAIQNTNDYQRRERIKQLYCIKKGYKFIAIPYNIPKEVICKFVEEQLTKKPIIVGKEFNIAYAHRLNNDFIDSKDNEFIFGKCNNKNYHGHNMRVIVEVIGFPDSLTGMVINFVELKRIVLEVLEEYDHKNLNVDNDEYIINTSTCENTLQKIWTKLSINLPNINKLTIYETPTSYATLAR